MGAGHQHGSYLGKLFCCRRFADLIFSKRDSISSRTLGVYLTTSFTVPWAALRSSTAFSWCSPSTLWEKNTESSVKILITKTAYKALFIGLYPKTNPSRANVKNKLNKVFGNFGWDNDLSMFVWFNVLYKGELPLIWTFSRENKLSNKQSQLDDCLWLNLEV